VIDALHLLLTYQCSRECPHCFVFGGPPGETMTSSQVKRYINAADRAGVEKIALEGGEPFLFYPTLYRAVKLCGEKNMTASLVTNGFWGISTDEAVKWLKPLTECAQLQIMISTDNYHGGKREKKRAHNVKTAATELGIEPITAETSFDDVFFRGRAASELAHRTEKHPWTGFDSCPNENLSHPSRVHVDANGFLQVCQGISSGCIEEQDLGKLVHPEHLGNHPVLGPLISGGPAALVTEFQLDHKGAYADACHLCYLARMDLREKYPEYLGPDRTYGVIN